MILSILLRGNKFDESNFIDPDQQSESWQVIKKLMLMFKNFLLCIESFVLMIILVKAFEPLDYEFIKGQTHDIIED